MVDLPDAMEENIKENDLDVVDKNLKIASIKKSNFSYPNFGKQSNKHQMKPKKLTYK